jgi:nitrogen fixation NifU-like protein
MSLRELYQEMIIDHSKQPRNFGVLANANHTQVGHNPLCGDRLVLYVFEKKNIIQDLRFEGTGCAISIASASLMTEAVKGKTLPEALDVFDIFHKLMMGEPQEQLADIGKLVVLSGVAQFPVRIKCATLAWHALKAALINDPHPTKTEE